MLMERDLPLSCRLRAACIADACSLQAQLSDGNVPLESRRKHDRKRPTRSRAMGGLGRLGAERGAQRKRPKLPSHSRGELIIPQSWILRLGGTPLFPRCPAGRPYGPYRLGGGASEATWTRPRPFRNFNGPTSWRIGRRFESLEYLPSQAGAHFG